MKTFPSCAMPSVALYDPADLIEEINKEVAKYSETHGLNAVGACLYYAHYAAKVLYDDGLYPIIQAGSMQWPMIRREEDNGKNDTHFSYIWDPGSPASKLAMLFGHLPEMHVWVGLPKTQEIVDCSTRHLKRAAIAAGLTWTAPDPPDFLWATAETMPDWVVYDSNRDATLLACELLDHLFKPDYLYKEI